MKEHLSMRFAAITELYLCAGLIYWMHEHFQNSTRQRGELLIDDGTNTHFQR